MKFQLNFTPEKLLPPIEHQHKIMLVGSCFAENIGNRLANLKFDVAQNPNGIIYDPLSVTNSIISYIDRAEYAATNLSEANGLWHSWQHHGSFSGPDAGRVLKKINDSQRNAHEFLKNADWVFITLGSAFYYTLHETGVSVANCHKVPASAFAKRLLTIEEIKSSLDTCIHRLFHFNPTIKIIFTVSPVRYIRDGLVENNLSKARLIEVVQHLVSKFEGIHYFAAYEIVNDVLRDYRFFGEDMVHPDSQAIDYVFEQFSASAFSEKTKLITSELARLNAALNHRPLHPGTPAHQRFVEKLHADITSFESRFPWLDFTAEKMTLLQS
jgi:hypothetical protein